MALRAKTFVTLPGTAFDALNWSSGQPQLLREATTGDICIWKATTADNKIQLVTSQNNGETYQIVATDASGASGTQPNLVLGVVQDSNGKVHCISHRVSDHRFAYTRFALTISNGHVTGYSIDQAFVLLPDHTPDPSSDPRGSIDIWTNGGTPKVVWEYQIGTTGGPNTDIQVYMGQFAISGTTTSSGMDGTGSDTQVYTHSTGGIITNHVYQALIGQERTSEHGYCTIGQTNSDYAQSVAASSDYDLFTIQLTKSGSNWAVGSATVINSVPGGGGTMPQLLNVCTTTGGMHVMYYSTNGISFAYMDSSGTLHDRWVTEPITTGTKSGFGAFWTNGTIILAYYSLFAATGTGAEGYFAYYDGTRWANKIIDDTIKNTGTEAMFGGTAWSNGLMVMRGIGSTLAQTRTGDSVGVMYFFTPDSTYTAPPAKRRYYPSLNMGVDIREWW